MLSRQERPGTKGPVALQKPLKKVLVRMTFTAPRLDDARCRRQRGRRRLCERAYF